MTRLLRAACDLSSPADCEETLARGFVAMGRIEQLNRSNHVKIEAKLFLVKLKFYFSEINVGRLNKPLSLRCR